MHAAVGLLRHGDASSRRGLLEDCGVERFKVRGFSAASMFPGSMLALGLSTHVIAVAQSLSSSVPASQRAHRRSSVVGRRSSVVGKQSEKSRTLVDARGHCHITMYTSAALVGSMFREGGNRTSLISKSQRTLWQELLAQRHKNTQHSTSSHVYRASCHYICRTVAGLAQNSSQCTWYLTKIRFTTMHRQRQQ